MVDDDDDDDVDDGDDDDDGKDDDIDDDEGDEGKGLARVTTANQRRSGGCRPGVRGGHVTSMMLCVRFLHTGGGVVV